MLQQNRDLDYVYLSTRVQAMECGLLTRERMERMLDAPTLDAAAKVLTECGYPDLPRVTPDAVEEILEQCRGRLMADLEGEMPQPEVLAVFQLQNDYHNAKVLVKAEALGRDWDRLLLRGGRYDPRQLAEDYRREDLSAYGESFCRGIARAREVLGATGDPQQADFALDRACFEDLTRTARDSGSEFLQGYAVLLIDAANLRAAVRASRLGKGADFLLQALVEGGNVPVSALAGARGEALAALFRGGWLAQAAAAGAAVSSPGSGPLTEFERLCDDAVTDYVREGHLIPFGLEPVAGYVYARQAEATAIRTILSGRMAGLEADTIRQRLRRTYC